MNFDIFIFLCTICAYALAQLHHKDNDNQPEIVRYKLSRHGINHFRRPHHRHSIRSYESGEDESDEVVSNNGLVIAQGHAEPDKYKLEQLQVLFRHGDRTPMKTGHKNDPYDEIYQSYGYEQLTKVGMQREYKIGQFLRKRYDAFLGKYRIDDVYAYSTDMDRTKMSLQLVSAGLYPPTPANAWSDSIDWQPIPTHYEAIDVSFLTAPSYCPQFNKIYEKTTNTSEALEIFQKYKDFFQRIKNNTGFMISTLFSLVPIYSNIHCALNLGLPLPDWCSEEDFQELKKLAAVGFKSITRTQRLRRMLAGPIVERFLKVINANGTSKKVYLYAGHDANIAAFIDAHNITGAPDLQDFGSALILEKLRGPDDRIYLRVHLWTGVSEKFLSLKFNDCEETCPLSDYQKIVQPILPNEASRTCTSSNAPRKRQVEN